MDEIRIGSGDTYAIVSSLGGTVVRFVYKGMDVIFPYRIVGEGKYRGGIPICFPFFGLSEAFPKMPRHGYLRGQELSIWNYESTRIVFGGSKGKAWNDIFPWNFECVAIASIVPSAGILINQLRVTRLMDGLGGRAPINPAFHPYFSNLGKREAVINGKTFRKFEGESSEVIAPIKTLITLGKLRVGMILGGSFDSGSSLTLWSDSNDYFCVEPVATHPMEYNTPKGKSLREGESMEISCILMVHG